MKKKKQIDNAKEFIKKLYPNVSFLKLGPIRYSSKNPLELVVVGPKLGESPLFLKDGSDLLKQTLDKTFVKNALSERAQQIIVEDRDTIKEQRQRLNEAEKLSF